MLFCLIYTDKPDALELRLANREAHLKYWGEAACVKIGGPFTNDDQSVMNGSLLVIDVADRAAAEKLVENDPYNKAGLFQHTDVRAWKWLLGPKE
ncbi:MAG: YciI family protein [Parvibaculum sp.]|uniref:YciI family protein n=1 Tax=Parvibaculum sp. TaxID=2024848 RepID=UPI00271938A5|nr:YciI family protein [Parvibaculum sp.]MDO8837648.1 YciI family protein [Parvibaculum sp.]MDP1625577.1 YciI family protein [Parvibaculum sp.]